MQKMFTVLALAAMMAVTAAAQGGKSDGAKKVTLTGVLSDEWCGRKHTMEHVENAGPSNKGCTQSCVDGGSAYALVTDDQVYVLDGETKGLYDMAGDTVTITGKLDGKKLTVERAEKSK